MTVISYAQNFEDVLLWRALGHIEAGFYVDVGAQHPDVDSVTRLFYDQGWRGINIEPVDEWHRQLVERRPRDINLKIAIGREAGEIDLKVFKGTGLSTAVDAYAAAHVENGFECERTSVPVRTLQSVCEQYHVSPIHFLKIDVEGFEGDVLASIDFASVRPWVVVVEATIPNSRVNNHDAWESHLTGGDYDFVYFDGLNRYYVARERAELRDHFACGPNVFDDFALSGTASSPFSAVLLGRIRDGDEECARARAETRRVETQLRIVRDELRRSTGELENDRRRLAAVPAPDACTRSRCTDAQYELDIARKRLAANTRSMLARDERILALEHQLEHAASLRANAIDDPASSPVASEGGRWHEAMERAFSRLEALLDERVWRRLESDREHWQGAIDEAFSRLGETVQAEAGRPLGHERAGDALVEGMARIEASISATVATADAKLEASRQEAKELSQALAEARGNADHWFDLHSQAADALEAQRARLEAVLETNHAWFVKAGEFERALARVEGSRSWRVTAPLRAARRGAVSAAKAVFRPPLLTTMRMLRRSPGLWKSLSRGLKSHPRLHERLKATALAAGIVQAPPVHSALPDPAMPPVPGPHEARMDISTYQLKIRRRIRPET